MNPPELRYIVQTTILKYLVCSSDISRDHLVMLEYFRGWGQGVFGDEILTQIIEDFPSQLTDELLVILSPPHLRHLKLTNCTRLSCNGLQKAVVKCQQLQALDFTECVHLLHPTVFCSIREKASNLVSLSLENSEVVSDDIVQVALMCCPFLKHLNLSSCKSITDAAFALSDSKNNTSSTASTNHTPQPGHSLTSVDISGCQSLSTVAVKYLVGLCGANLTSINLAWTGINCTALLYLAGLNIEKVARMMCFADRVQTDSVSSSRKAKKKLAFANLDESCRALCDDQDLSTQGFLGSNPIEESTEDTYDFSDSQLNEMEVSTLMNVLPMACEPSLLQSTGGILHLHVQESNEPSEVPCHEELTSDVDLIRTCGSFLPEKVTRSTAHEKESTSNDQQLLETEDIETYVHSDEDIMKKATDMKRAFQCWDVASEVEPLKDSKVKNGSFNSVLLPSVQEQSLLNGLEAVPMKKEHHIERNPTTLTTTKNSIGELETEEILEDKFDTESHPVEDHFNHGHAVGMGSLRMGCDIPSMPTEVLTLPSILLVSGMEPDTPTIPCEKVKENGSVVIISEESGCPIVTPATVKPENSVCPIIPSVELHEMDEEAECEEPPIHCKVEVENSVLPMAPCKKETDYNNDSLSTIPYIMSETAESSTSSITAHRDEKGMEFDHSITTCWEDEAVFPECETEQGKQSSCSMILPDVRATAEKHWRDWTLSHSKAIQVTDLLQTQLFQPQITSLDITNMWYQSKPLGQACLKIFSDANKCLKNFAVSWSELDDRMLTYLLKNLPELECLSLVDCEKLSNISLSSIPIHCPKLSSFDLKGMCYVTDHGLMPLTRSNHLQSLSLAEAPITDCTLDSIAKGCGTKLKVLDISWCEDVTDEGMAIIAKSCRSLQHLGLRQCAASKRTLHTLADNCHLVSSLNIAGIDNLTDAALGSLAENMPLLREIDASWNSSLSDTGISALLRCCNKLKKVVLCGLKLITSQPFLGIIGDLKRWQLLEEIWRYGKRHQTSSSQGKVALKTCDSETAKSLGDEIPSRSMSYASSLRHMVLEYSDKVNDDHLAAIVAVCRGTLYVKDYYGQQIEPKWIFR